MTGKVPAPTATPVAPPAPLMGGMNQTLQNWGPQNLFQTMNTLGDIQSGQDIGKIFSSIVDANKRFTEQGEANLKESFGASGMRFSTDMMRSIADYNLQSQKDLQAQLGQLSMQGEQLKLGAAGTASELYGNAAMAYAPTQVVAGGQAGPSPFQQAMGAIGGVAQMAAMFAFM